MQNFQIKNKQFLRTIDPTGKLLEALQSIEDEVNAQKSQTGATGVGTPEAPPAPQGISVTAAAGIFQATVTDATAGVNYFLEYSSTAGFNTFHTIALGPGKTYRAKLGNQLVFWRVRSGFPTAPSGAPLSTPTYFVAPGQTSPTPVQGGGADIGPAI